MAIRVTIDIDDDGVSEVRTENNNKNLSPEEVDKKVARTLAAMLGMLCADSSKDVNETHRFLEHMIGFARYSASEAAKSERADEGKIRHHLN